MNVVYLSPGFPAEMPLFVRGLSQVGAKVYGVGDQPASALPPEAREALTDYLQIRGFGDEPAGRGYWRVDAAMIATAPAVETRL